ncbi:MAG: alanine racemase [Rhodoglobus sp.]
MREAVIDLGAIARNVATLKAATGGAPTMVVVKANGYGHGAVASARAALDGGADWLGVVDLEEALELRAAGIRAPILAWLHDPETDYALAAENDIDVGVNYLGQLERVSAATGRLNVHIKVDTGLNRNGVPEDEWGMIFAAAADDQAAGRITVRGIFSHLANAGADADAAQVAGFQRALDAAAEAGLTPEISHLAATAGAIRVPAARFGLVRIGIGAYGLSPFDDAESVELGLTPAMQLGASVVSVKRVPVGSGVSYGHEYVTDRETTLALVPLGYADGVPRQASGVGPVSINGVTYRVCGRVAMDQIVVDVGDAPVAIGDRAILFGDPATGVPSATDWARAAGTINYEIVTRIGSRVARKYLPGPTPPVPARREAT